MKRPKRCRNCGAYLPEEHQYCIFCGKKVRKVIFDFNPKHTIQALYGPPDIYDFDCPNCGKQWTSSYFGKNRTKYCPDCGFEVQRTKVSLEEFKKRIDKNKT